MKLKLKYLITFALLMSGRVWAIGDTWRGNGQRLPLMVSAGETQTCALGALEVKCWGDESTKVPDLKSPSQLSAGGDHACALDSEGVKCWGRNREGQINVPLLKSPVQVSAGWFHSCALDAEGVKCWGSWQYTKVPALNSPIQVSAGAEHTCALDAEGVKCWGANHFGQSEVPTLKSPVQVSAGYTHSCALDAEGVKCWGFHEATNVPVLKSPIQLSSGWHHSCALDAEGVKCWGSNTWGQLDVPILKSPVQVSAGRKQTCALDSEGLKCWGGNDEGQTNVPSLFLDIVKDAIPFMSSSRAEYLNSITGFASVFKVNTKTYYFECLLVSPAILSFDSGYFTETYLLVIKVFIERLQKSLGYSYEITEIPDSKEHRELAILSIQSALSVSLNYISQDHQTLLQESLRAAGVATTDPTNNQKIKDLVAQIDSLSAEKQKLKSSPKSAFLVESLEVAATWLREKVK